MFPTYNSLAEVPEEFRPHYVMKGGKAVAELSSDHPLVVNNATLVSEKTTAEGKATAAESKAAAAEAKAANLQSELDAAKSSSLPRGHKAVPTADAELIEAVKAKGVTTADAFNALHKEHGEYKTTADEATAAKHAQEVGAAMGWDKDKTARLVPKHFDLSTVELRDGKDGKKEAVAKVKQPDGTTVVEKPFGDVVKATPELSDLLPLLTSKTGPVIATQGVGDPPASDRPLSDKTMEGWGPKKEAKAA